MPAEHYTVLRSLAGSGEIISLKQEASELALRRCGLEDLEEATASGDRQLLAEARKETPGALLCLRCRVSRSLEQCVRTHYRDFHHTYGVELAALAAFALDDRGGSVPFCHVPPPAEFRVPFTVEVIRSFDPERAGLPHWARQRLIGRNDYKAYLLEMGVLLIGKWALLGDCSHRQVHEAMVLPGQTTSLTPETAEALHRRYLLAYRKAKLTYRQRTGRQRGWEPDAAFFQEVDPQRHWADTEDDLHTMEQAVRRLQTGRWQSHERNLLSMQGSDRAEEQLADPGATHLERLVDQEHDSAIGVLAAEALEAEGLAYVQLMLAGLAVEAEQWCFWRGWLEGQSTREIAACCGAAQARVSRRLSVQIRAREIATRALQRLAPLPAFTMAFGSPEKLDAAADRLVNHLLISEQQGEDPPLRRWLRIAMHNIHTGTTSTAREESGGMP
ncbi:hypothetical protein KQ303_06495 [Synechococcus sp. CS-1333]|nr:hypothetical protein [Synechococcus sp. CS-1333]